MNYVKSKQRVADHGEVFTPPWMVEAMLDLVKDIWADRAIQSMGKTIEEVLPPKPEVGDPEGKKP